MYKHVRGGEVWWDENPEGAEPLVPPTVYARAVEYREAKASGERRRIENARSSLLGVIKADLIEVLVLGVQP